MTTVTDSNVHNVAVKGTFDDCQVCSSNSHHCIETENANE
jgi:threonine synthase